MMIVRGNRNFTDYNGTSNPFGLPTPLEYNILIQLNRQAQIQGYKNLRYFDWQKLATDNTYKLYGLGYLDINFPNVIHDSSVQYVGLPDRAHLAIARMDTVGKLKGFSTIGLFKGFVDPKLLKKEFAVSDQGLIGLALEIRDTVYLPDTTLHTVRTFQQNAIGSRETVVCRYDPDGELEWFRHIRVALDSSQSPFGGARIQPQQVDFDQDGNLYVLISIQSNDEDRITSGTDEIIPCFEFRDSENGSFILKYDFLGNLIWQQQVSCDDLYASLMSVDMMGNVYVARPFWSSPDSAKLHEGPTIPPTLGPLDGRGLLLKYSPNGDYLWHQMFGDKFGHTIREIETLDAESLIIASGFNVSSKIGDTIVFARGASDFFIAQMDVCQPTIAASGRRGFCPDEGIWLHGNTCADRTYQWLRDGLPISGSTSPDYLAEVSGGYQVILTHQSQSDTSEIFHVAALPAAPKPTVSIGLELCENGTFQTFFTPNLLPYSFDFLAYEWPDASRLRNWDVTYTGQDSVDVYTIYTDQNGCRTSSDTFTYVFDTLPPPAPLIYQGGGDTLWADPQTEDYTDIYWYSNGDLIGEGTFIVGTPFQLYEVVTEDNFCFSPPTEYLYLPTSLDPGLEAYFTLSPNPVSRQLEMRKNQFLDADGRVSFYSMEGKLLRTEDLSRSTTEKVFDVRQWPAGIIICHIKIGDSVSTQKVIITRK
ncbi:MAG: T9SS type A sorting domain-containing protein [Bacteroidota bacterium]